jgi:peptidoglycan/xylan/chitin deacetylase (PgdA/CDA1 family)
MTQMLASSPVTALASRRRGLASIFMLHRFQEESGGHDPAVVRQLLDWLRRQRFEVLDLEELFRRLAEDGPSLRRAVAITIDDGYRCQAEVAAPIFAEYDVPVTTFLTTGFLDGELWLWWDQIEYILRETRRDRVDLTVAARRLDLDLGPAAQRRQAARVVKGHYKSLPDGERVAAIAQLAERAGVLLPATPPSDYAPMTWEQARRCEAAGMRFGPHTVTHPILSRTGDAQARHELEVSWERLCQELSRPMPIFCYPNGLRGDYGPREVATLRGMGLRGAVTAEPGYATDAPRSGPEGMFGVPRFCFSEEHGENLRYASGLEWLRQQASVR